MLYTCTSFIILIRLYKLLFSQILFQHKNKNSKHSLKAFSLLKDFWSSVGLENSPLNELKHLCWSVWLFFSAHEKFEILFNSTAMIHKVVFLWSIACYICDYVKIKQNNFCLQHHMKYVFPVVWCKSSDHVQSICKQHDACIQVKGPAYIVCPFNKQATL